MLDKKSIDIYDTFCYYKFIISVNVNNFIFTRGGL